MDERRASERSSGAATALSERATVAGELMTGALELTRRSFVSANSGDYQRHASIWLWDEGVARSVTHYRDVDAARKLALETVQSKK